MVRTARRVRPSDRLPPRPCLPETLGPPDGLIPSIRAAVPIPGSREAGRMPAPSDRTRWIRLHCRAASNVKRLGDREDGARGLVCLDLQRVDADLPNDLSHFLMNVLFRKPKQ